MLPYYFGLIKVMRGGWKQQIQQCCDTTSGEEWGLARWAIKLSYTHSEDLCIWQLSDQPFLNTGFVKARLGCSSPSSKVSGTSQTLQRTWWQSYHCEEGSAVMVFSHWGKEKGSIWQLGETNSPFSLGFGQLSSWCWCESCQENSVLFEMSSLIYSVMKNVKLGTSASTPRNRQEAWGKMFKQNRSKFSAIPKM